MNSQLFYTGFIVGCFGRSPASSLRKRLSKSRRDCFLGNFDFRKRTSNCLVHILHCGGQGVAQKIINLFEFLRGELLTGEIPAAKRSAIVNNFQSGISPVFVGTFGSGGVGITLTSAHTIILLDRPWTPG